MTIYPAPYRVDFFNKIGKSCELTVAFEEEPKQQLHRDATWFNSDYSHFNAVFLKKAISLKGKKVFTDIIPLIKQKWDVIILGGYSSLTSMLAIEYMRLHRIPFFIEVDGGLIRPDSKAKYWLKKHLVSSACGWFSTGKTVTDYLVHYGAKRERCYQYSFTSQTESDMLAAFGGNAAPAVFRNKLGISEKTVVLMVGQVIPRKGIDILIRAAKRMPETIGFYIVGGEEKKEYKALTRGMKNIHFVGFKVKKELVDYYRAADLFVLPTREDIWGLAVNEAMSFGLPVVTTDKCVAGIELIDGNGYIVPVEDDDVLAEKMMKILSDPELAAKMRNRSREIIKNYTIENMAEDHLKYFERIISES